MGRKNRDLFEILGARSRGNGSGLVQRVQEIVAPAPPAKPRSKSAKPGTGKSAGKPGAGSPGGAKAGASGGRPAAPSTTGLVIAAVAFACLAIGFVGGRWSVSAAGGEDLNAPASGEQFGHRPARFGAAESGGASGLAPLTDAELTEKLSTWGHYLLPFPVLETADRTDVAFGDAKRLIQWLRDRGFSRVRVRKMSRRGQSFWVVLNYVQSADDKADYVRLKELESPEFAPGFADYVARNPQINHLEL